jgi:hypothetical protein
VSLHVGRVSYEKNIDAFLALDPPGSEVVCGGALHDDLRQACHDALAVPRDQARLRALDFSWARSGELFVSHLVPARRQPILPDRAAALTTVMKVSSGG